MLDTVLEYADSNLAVLPCHPIEKRPQVRSWSAYQAKPAGKDKIKEWFGNGKDYSPAIITGSVSGNLELLDFDERARQYELWKGLVQEQKPGLVDRLVVQRTQNGGLHVAYRCPSVDIPGNQKLSVGAIEVHGSGEHFHDGKGYRAIQYRGKWVITPTLIETRGTGGYFLAFPGKGYQILAGSFCDIPEISSDERQVLIECAEVLTELVKEQPAYPSSTMVQDQSNQRPGDAFNQNVSIQSLLQQDGWRTSGRSKSLPDGTIAELWIRPGKQKGTSATVYDNKIHVFSSNAAPLEPRVTYDPFSYYSTTRHGGDYRQAASELATQGYGVSSVSDNKQVSAGVSHNNQKSATISNRERLLSDCEQTSESRKQSIDDSAPLSTLIRDYLKQYSGTFSVYEIDREFSVTTRAEKNNRAQILNRLSKEHKIKKIHGKVGQWKTIDGGVTPMKLGSKPIVPLDIVLPLGLSDLAQILPGNIILVAGAPNGGKTAFLLTVAFTLLNKPLYKEKKLNNTKDVSNNGNCPAPSEGGVSVSQLASAGVRYLNSEMDEHELTDRCSSFPNGLEIFSNGCEFIQRYHDFADIIIPNGINFIDYLEIHEDFFELGKLINEIHQSLTTGICFIAVQKKQGADYAKGGASSLEKPRLVVNLDKNEGYGKICKIVKCKKTVQRGDNHDGKEIDFNIDKNSAFVFYSPWRYVNEKQRKLINRDYETKGMQPLPEKKYAFVFRLKDGSQGRLLENQVERWQKEFCLIDVRRELRRIEGSSRVKPFLDTGWFHAIPALLGKVTVQKN